MSVVSNSFVKNQYNKLAGNYLASRDQFKNDKYLEKLNAILSPKSHILDIGCGAGIPVDRFFVEKGHSVMGIDISEKQIELAKKNVPQGNFKVEDMSLMRDGEYSVDAVVSFYAIFHTKRETHEDILHKINSFLKKDGYLLITMGASEWEGKEDDFFGGGMEWSHYGVKKNLELVKNANFEIIFSEVDTSGNEKHLIILAQKK
jgi:cyclopropane fatty-acyl-phospholipid synthase-like methyltransferase